MVDYTKITVSKDGKYLFATEQGHLTYPGKQNGFTNY